MSAHRRNLARVAGVLGLLLYNWWVVAAWDRRVLPSPNELFSDLEATGQPYASVLSRLDLAAGALLLLAVVLSRAPATQRWARDLLAVFALAAALGGFFPYNCAEGIASACRSAEWTMRLPWPHYVHIVAGIVEFVAATGAIVMLRNDESSAGRTGTVARALTKVLLVAYPLLAAAYLTHTWGAFIEPVFFISFSVAVGLVVFEPDSGRRSRLVRLRQASDELSAGFSPRRP